jgi:hypothetical protein
MPAKKNPRGPYTVGFGKPPRQTQFKKGRSGNPTGRPKGTPNFATALEHALGEQVIVNEGGQRRTVSKLEATVKQLVNKATLGDPRATQQVLNVVHVIDSESGELSPTSPPLTDADAKVMEGLINRIRTILKGESHDDTHA